MLRLGWCCERKLLVVASVTPHLVSLSSTNVHIFIFIYICQLLSFYISIYLDMSISPYPYLEFIWIRLGIYSYVRICI